MVDIKKINNLNALDSLLDSNDFTAIEGLDIVLELNLENSRKLANFLKQDKNFVQLEL